MPVWREPGAQAYALSDRPMLLKPWLLARPRIPRLLTSSPTLLMLPPAPQEVVEALDAEPVVRPLIKGAWAGVGGWLSTVVDDPCGVWTHGVVALGAQVSQSVARIDTGCRCV